MSKGIFDGYYGFQNTGDDAFVEVSSWGAKEYWNKDNCHFFGSKLPEVSTQIVAHKKMKKGLDRVQMFNNCLNSDFYVLAGGSTLHDYKITDTKNFAITAKSINKRLKLGGIGVSIGPFKSTDHEKRIKNFLSKLDFLSVRDQKSFEIAQAFKLPYQPIKSFDLAALLPLIYGSKNNIKKESDDKKKVVTISYCNYESYSNGDVANEKKRFDYFRKIILELASDKSVYFKALIFNGNELFGDLNATQQLFENVPKEKFEIVPYSLNPKLMWDVIGKSDLLVCTRLHAAVYAAFQNVPFLLGEYHRKCSDFLTDLGYDNNQRIYDCDLNIDQAISKVASIIQGEYILPTQVNSVIELSKLNFTETKKMF